MKLINPTKETLSLTIPTGRGGGVENLTVAPGETCEVADGYVGMAKRRGLAEATGGREAPTVPIAAIPEPAAPDTVGTATEEWGAPTPPSARKRKET